MMVNYTAAKQKPRTLGAGPTGTSKPGEEWNTPGLTWRCLSAASPVYLPISRVVARLPDRALSRPGQGGRGEREDQGGGKEGGCSHGEPPVLPVITLS